MGKKILTAFVLVLLCVSVFSATIIQVRRDTSTNWTSVNPILAQGEIGLETNTLKMKFGDGNTAWTSLAYYSTGVGGSANINAVAPLIWATDTNKLSISSIVTKLVNGTDINISCTGSDTNGQCTINSTASVSGGDENHTGISPITFNNVSNQVGLNVSATSDWNGTFDGFQGVDLNRWVGSRCSGDANSVWTSSNNCVAITGFHIDTTGAASAVTGLFEGGNIDINSQTGDIRIHFDDGNFLNTFHRWTAPQTFTADINANRINTTDLNAGAGRIISNSLFYSLSDLNRSAVANCGSDLNSVLNSRGQCVSIAGFDIDTTGAAAGDTTLDTNEVARLRFLAGVWDWNGPQRHSADINAARINAKDINSNMFRVWSPDDAGSFDINWTNNGLTFTSMIGGYNLDLVGFDAIFSSVNLFDLGTGDKRIRDLFLSGTADIATAIITTLTATNANFTKAVVSNDLNAFPGKTNIFDLNVGNGLLKTNTANYSIANDLNKFEKDTNIFSSGVADCAAGNYLFGFNSNGTTDCRSTVTDGNANFVQKGTVTQQTVDANVLVSHGGGQIKLVPDQNMIVIGGIWCIKTINAGGDLNLSIAGC